jgi:hypothetical protein
MTVAMNPTTAGFNPWLALFQGAQNQNFQGSTINGNVTINNIIIPPSVFGDQLFNSGYGQQGFQTPGFPMSPAFNIPQPQLQFSGAPAGRGLTKGVEGFGENAIRTAGGYTIVPEGKDAAWSIFAPGQKPGEKPMTRIWGDPHVDEKDGTRWDFTKNSNFRLPDGTNISVGTTAQTGFSVTSSLDITNGADRVQVSGIQNNKPQVGAVTTDGYEARARLNNANDTFHLGGNGDSEVRWFRERNGKLEGEVQHAPGHRSADGQSFDQKINADAQYVVDPKLRPQFGSDAWGNQLRSEAVDIARRSGNQQFADNIGQLMFADHLASLLASQNPFFAMALGGYGGMGGFGEQQFSVGNLFAMLQMQEAYNQMAMAGRLGRVG